MSSSTNTKPKLPWSRSKCIEIVEKRRNGVYHTEDTLEESVWSFNHADPGDLCYYIHMKAGMFMRFNQSELLNQLNIWRKIGGFKCHDYNVLEIKIGDKTAYTCVVQPPDYEIICPLMLAHGIMVSGVGYICDKKSTADLIVRALNQ